MLLRAAGRVALQRRDQRRQKLIRQGCLASLTRKPRPLRRARVAKHRLHVSVDACGDPLVLISGDFVPTVCALRYATRPRRRRDSSKRTAG